MAANDSALTCANKDKTFFELFLNAVGKDASGKPTLRVYDSAAVAGDNFIDCANMPTEPMDLARQLFTLDSNGDVALRVSIP